MSATTKICSACGKAKPRSEFYIAHKATATRKAKLSSRCKPCEADRKQQYAGQATPGKINRNRARHRAVADLIERYSDEFEALYEQRLAEAEEEAAALAAESAAKKHYNGEPVRLRPGRRRQGEKPVDRIDVARCPHCIRHHDRGHVCAVCGAAPGASLSDSRNGNRVTHNASRRATNQILDTRNQSDDGHLNEQASKVGNLPTDATPRGATPHRVAEEQANEQAACSNDDRLSDKPPRRRPRVYDDLGLPRKAPPGIDPAALAEFNAGTQRAREAARR